MGMVDSVLTARSLLSRLLGARFGGSRDYWSTFGYLPTPTFRESLLKYTRQDIASRIVDMPADSLWDNPPVIISNDPAWNEAWDNLVTNFNLWHVLNRVDRLAALDLYAILVVGVSGQPLDREGGAPRGRPRKGRAEVVYLQPYSATSAPIDAYDESPSSPNYMLPSRYKLTGGEADQSSIQGTATGVRRASRPDVKVDASRVVHVADGVLETNVFGTPRIHRVFNLLDDLLKVVGGSAETFWMTSDRGLQIDVDKEMQLSPADGDALSDELDEYIHGRRRMIRTRGVTINPLGSETPSPAPNFDTITSLIAATVGIPKRILIGSEAGQLASEQDRSNWAERIGERRQHFAEPTVLFPLIRKLTALQVLPSPDQLTITIQWPDAFKLSPLERAQTSAQKARSAANLIKVFTTALPGTGVTVANPSPGTKPDIGEDTNTAAKGGTNTPDPNPLSPATKSGGPNTQAFPPKGSGGNREDGNGNAVVPPSGGSRVIPAEIPGYQLLSIEEARSFMELVQPVPTFNETSDVVGESPTPLPASPPKGGKTLEGQIVVNEIRNGDASAYRIKVKTNSADSTGLLPARRPAPY